MRQIIIAGFHRSGTSMAAQMLNKAGLFLGSRLMPCDISNPDGHFEDTTVVEFHDEILARHELDWRVASSAGIALNRVERGRLKEFCDRRDAKYSAWGVKDPRICLFLNDWFDILGNPAVVCVYRHYEYCFDSLIRRHATAFALHPSGTGTNLSFALFPELGFRMWKEYNSRLLEFAKDNPERTIVVAQQAILNGAPMIKELNARFNLGLNHEAPSGVRPELGRRQIVNSDYINPHLRGEMDEIWAQLEGMAWRRADRPVCAVRKIDEDFETQRLQELLRDLIPASGERPSPAVSAGDVAAAAGFSLDRPECIVERARRLVEEDLIEQAMTLLVAAAGKYPLHSGILTELGDHYRRLNRSGAAELVYLRAISIGPVKPHLYMRLALALAGQGRLGESEHFMRQALTLNPRNPWFYRELATILARQELLDEAIKVIADGRRIFPDDIFIAAQEATLLRDAGRIGEAAVLCLDTLNRHRESPRILIEGYRVLTALGWPDEGADLYYRARYLQIKANASYANKLKDGLAGIQNADLRAVYTQIVNDTIEETLYRGRSSEGMMRASALRIKLGADKDS